METNLAQKQAIETRGRALVVEAGAGTGKTSVLVERFVYLLESNPDWPLESIVAITFTKKAAREMRTRLRQAIDEKAEISGEASVWAQRRRELERLQVSTIHSLCARILRENAIAVGVDPQFTAIEEQEMQVLQEDTIRQAFNELVNSDNPGLELLAGLNIREVREELAELLSRRGTVQRLFDELKNAEDLIVKWNAGLKHMREVLWKEQAQKLEVESALGSVPFLEIPDVDDKLKEYVTAAQQGCAAIQDGEIAAACRFWKDIKLNVGSQKNWGGKPALEQIKDDLKALREAAEALDKKGCLEEIGPLDEQAAHELHLWKLLWIQVVNEYEQMKERRHALDFDDLELRASLLLNAPNRDKRLQDYLDGINHLMVDEFQDTNEVQQSIIYALAHPTDGEKLFIVGDAKQSIYRFRQAQVSVFNRTGIDIKAATRGNAIPLDTSYRTHEQLVTVVNSMFAQILRPQGRDYEEYEARPGALTANRPSPASIPTPVELVLIPQAGEEPDIKVNTDDGRTFEAQQIALRLRQLHDSKFQIWDKKGRAYRNFRFSDAVILFRATTDVPLYEEQFKTFGLPYLTVSGRGYYDRPEVRDLISLLSALNNPADDLNLASVLRSPIFGLNDETLYRLRWFQSNGEISGEPIPYKHAVTSPPATGQNESINVARLVLKELWGLVGQTDIWRLLRRAVDLTGYEVSLALSDQGEEGGGRQHNNIQKFLEMARDRNVVSLSEFLRRIDDLRTREAREGEALGSAPESGTVQVMSIHAAKGLEFPVVVIADLGRRPYRAKFPIILHDPVFGIVCKTRMADEMQQPPSYQWGKWLTQRMEEAENKRLLYVAFTRAADLLILSGQMGDKTSWMNTICSILDVSPHGEIDETLSRNGFILQVKRPIYGDIDNIESEPTSPQTNIDMKSIPLMARPFISTNLERHFAVTHIRKGLERDHEILPIVRPAVRSSEPKTGITRVPQYLIGRVVHNILANWSWLSLPRVELEQHLITYAHREGINNPAAIAYTVQHATEMIENLRQSPLFDEIEQSTQRLSELPFVYETSLGTLHGVIDLLFRDMQNNWHVVDWKTDWVDENGLEDKVKEYRQQIAVYVNAVQRILGFTPNASVCFLALKSEIHSFEYQELIEAFQSLVSKNT